jgi:hypothetical protein
MMTFYTDISEVVTDCIHASETCTMLLWRQGLVNGESSNNIIAHGRRGGGNIVCSTADS